MNASAIAIEISSTGTGGATQAAVPAGGESFQSYLNSALDNANPALSSTTQQNPNSPKNNHAVPHSTPLPGFYPNLNILNSSWPSLMPSGPGEEKIQAGRSATAPHSQEGSPTEVTHSAPAKANGEVTGEPISQLPLSKTSRAISMMVGSAQNVPDSGQDSLEIQQALASLEALGLSTLSASEGRVPLPSALQSKAVAAVSETKHLPTVKPALGGKPLSPKASPETSETSGKGEQSSGGSDPQARSADGDSPAPPKAAPEASGDNSKNTSSQESSGKPSSTSLAQASSAGNTAGSDASATSAAEQAAVTGFPQALNQAAQGANPATHAEAPGQSTASPAGGGDKIAAALDTPVNISAGVVNSASLVQSPGKAEIHVAMQTDALGALQLHAVLDNGQLGASIQVVSHDAHTLLSNDLPALQQVLTDQNLRVDRLAVINSPMTSGAGAGDRHSFQSEDFNRRERPDTRWLSTPAAPVVASSSGEVSVLENLRGRLSVRA